MNFHHLADRIPSTFLHNTLSIDVLLAVARGSLTPYKHRSDRTATVLVSNTDHVVWALAGRLCVSHNTRLGVYDPIRNMWQVPPSNVEECDEQMRLKAHGHIPTKRKVPTSPNVGVYDPVR